MRLECDDLALRLELNTLLSETMVRYTSSGTTGEPKNFYRAAADFVQAASPKGSEQDIMVLGYLPRTFAGLHVIYWAVRHRATLRAARLHLLHTQTAGATHLSTTPTLMRRLLLAGADLSTLRQITLGGEASSQPMLDELKVSARQARITQIYASSEHGVMASWSDGLSGIPAEMVKGRAMSPGDLFTTTDGRAYFSGRSDGLVSIAGQTINPSVIESVMADIPGVLAVRVRAVVAPLTGAVLIADVVGQPDPQEWARLMEQLPKEGRPRFINFTDSLPITAAGKIART